MRAAGVERRASCSLLGHRRDRTLGSDLLEATSDRSFKGPAIVTNAVQPWTWNHRPAVATARVSSDQVSSARTAPGRRPGRVSVGSALFEGMSEVAAEQAPRNVLGLHRRPVWDEKAEPSSRSALRGVCETPERPGDSSPRCSYSKARNVPIKAPPPPPAGRPGTARRCHGHGREGPSDPGPEPRSGGGRAPPAAPSEAFPPKTTSLPPQAKAQAGRSAVAEMGQPT